MWQQRSESAQAGMLRGVLETPGLENEASRAEPCVLIVSVPSYLRGRRDMIPEMTETQGGQRNPMGRTALWRCLLLSAASRRQEPSAK